MGKAKLYYIKNTAVPPISTLTVGLTTSCWLADTRGRPGANLTRHTLNGPKACIECCDVDAPNICRKEFARNDEMW